MASQREALHRLVGACTARNMTVAFGGQGATGPIPGLEATYLGNRVAGLPQKLAALA